MKRGIEDSYSFDETAWTKIALVLPDDEELRKAVLNDFIWFMGRRKSYKSNIQKVKDYINHLKLKQRLDLDVLKKDSNIFMLINIDLISEKLQSEYGKLD